MAATVILCAVDIFKEKNTKKYVRVMVIFCIIMLLNVGVNYRETNTLVLFENYSGFSIYQANNSNIKTYEYNSSLANDFVEERFWKIENDKSLTRGQKSEIMNEWAKDYMKTHFSTVINNVIVKFNKFFVVYFGWDIWLTIVAFLVSSVDNKKKLGILISIAFIEAIITSTGLLIHRYSAFIVLIYILFKVLLLDQIIYFIRKISNGKEILS